MAYRPELDGIRGVAVLLVLVGHTHFAGLPKAGQIGVTLFFVLSGYLITGLLVAERRRTGRIDLRAFYVRRVRRLLPALLAVVVATGGLMALLGRWDEYPGQATATMLYAANLAYSAGAKMGLLAHTWSLSLEEQFYILWPAAFLLLRGRALLVAVIVGILASSIARLVVQPGLYPVSFRPELRVDAVLWGCLIALVPVRLPRWGAALGWLAVAALVVTAHTNGDLTQTAIASVAVVLTARPGVLSWRPLVRMGQISYAVYLWHYAPSVLLAPDLVAGNVLAMLTVVTVGIGMALVSERWIERRWRLRRDDPVSQVLHDVEVAGRPRLDPVV